jgi:glucosylceramidase
VKQARASIWGMGLVLLLTACGSSSHGGGGGDSPGAGGATPGGGGSATGGHTNSGGTGGAGSGLGGGTPATAGAGGAAAGSGGAAQGVGGGQPGGAPAGGGVGGAPGSGGSGPPSPASVLVTSALGDYWKVGTYTQTTATGDANVTVNASTAQAWYGFGGAFNEIGWNVLTSKEMQDQAVRLLFSATDGANFAWGLIPIGATDYSVSRYTLDDKGADDAPNSGETNRPAADPTLANFSLDRDGQLLIPYVKAAQAVKRDLRFWAVPWTPPLWMKSGYKRSDASRGNAAKPSYYDGGNMRSDAVTLTAYAQYFVKFVQGYRAKNIDVELVAPQTEPTFEQNFPSCVWDKATYTTFVGSYLGPAMKALNVSVILGDLTNAITGGGDLAIAEDVLADPAAKGFVSVVGVEWAVLDEVNSGLVSYGDLPVWVTTHKYGNYPFCGSGRVGCPGPYNATQAPNDHAYGVESWGYIRDAITKGRVSVYHAWNMVLDEIGLGIDTSRDWKQDALLVADGGKVTATPAYYVFRHFSQYVVPGARVVDTTGGDAVAFKNPDGSLVAVVFNSGAANDHFTIAMAGKKLQFAMPANGWATVKFTP